MHPTNIYILKLENKKYYVGKSHNPIYRIQNHYENNGSKPGIVYVSGAIVKKGELLIYYGGADNYVCVASANLNKFLRSLKENKKPKLKKI